ncbi:hypothetical protein FMN50_13205 [Rhodobacterales bacterium]|nr:hypothetical protein FMN50_13205 [Rhodobacterales bacterium]
MMFEDVPEQETDDLAAHVATQESSYSLGMPELSHTGLSEQWMLKTLGDRHWRLIAAAAGQAKASFRDRNGREVYAAFCGLSVAAPHFGRPDLDDRLDIRSTLHRVSPARLASEHVLRIGATEIARVCLVSTFISRTRDGENRSVARVDFPGLPVLPALPARQQFPREAARLARQGADGHFGLAMPAELTRGPDETLRPNPSLDFNRAGLLYFPSFVAVAERAVGTRMGRASDGLVLRRRDVLFFGNVELHEPISVFVTDCVHDEDRFRAAVALKGSDDRPLCQVFCEYGRA